MFNISEDAALSPIYLNLAILSVKDTNKHSVLLIAYQYIYGHLKISKTVLR
jgi:hypothetical protein